MSSDHCAETQALIEPVDLEHIVELIERRGESTPSDHAVRVIMDTQGQRVDLDWQDLRDRARRAAGCFRSRGLLPGQRILIMLPTTPDYLAALFGALGCGLVPSSIASFGERGGFQSRDEWHALADTLGPAALVTDLEQTGTNIPHVSLQELRSAEPLVLEAQHAGPCYVQFSSGSTGQPKGIVLHWSAIQANLRAIADRIPLTADDHMFSWLPMHHDMGLFGTLLAPLFAGGRVTLMDPKLFVSNPLFWFRSMAQLGATITTTPPSALHFALQYLQRRPQAELDLACLQKVICGSEPVTSLLVREFRTALEPYGVGAAVFKPVYGLAENTLAVTIPPLPQGPRVETIDKHAFEARSQVVAGEADTTETVDVVCVGPALDGIDIRIGGPDGRDLGENQVGHVLIRSPSLLQGWIEHQQFRAREDTWFDTGDLGFVHQGELFITGRWKDIIVKNGRNYSPERLEALAVLAPEVQRAVAFGVFDPRRQSENVILLLELRQRDLSDPDVCDRVCLDVRAGLGETGYPVDELYLVPKGRLARTTSGKIRRRHCREEYLRGAFREPRQ